MKEKNAGGLKAVITSICLEMLISIMAAILLLLPCAGLISGGIIGIERMPLLIMGSAFAASLLASLLAWKRLRARAMIIGAGGAVLTFVILMVISMLTTGELPVAAQALCMFLSLLAGGVLGAVLRLIKKKRRK